MAQTPLWLSQGVHKENPPSDLTQSQSPGADFYCMDVNIAYSNIYLSEPYILEMHIDTNEEWFVIYVATLAIKTCSIGLAIDLQQYRINKLTEILNMIVLI